MSVSDGTYIAAMLAELGWRVPDLGAARYPCFDWSDELARQLDAVLLSTEPYRFTEAHADALEKQLGRASAGLVVLRRGKSVAGSVVARAVVAWVHGRDGVEQGADRLVPGERHRAGPGAGADAQPAECGHAAPVLA